MKKINDIEAKSPFKVPKNYFEEVNKKILAATSDSNSEKKRVGITARFRPYLAIAASIAGFVLISYITVKLLTVKTDNYNISEVLSDVSTEFYVNELDISSLEENMASSEFIDEASGLSRSEIIEYLISENIEITDIYEKL